MKILIFGGTGEARALADRLVSLGHDVTTSLAGRTRDPLLPSGAVRSGGFGGPERLRDYLEQERFGLVVDATHPFAERISAGLPEAAAAAGIGLLTLQRPPWQPPQGAIWIGVRSVAEAVARIPDGARVLVTSGHAGLAEMAGRDGCHFLVRLIEPPLGPLPGNAMLILDRPPYTLAAEMALMQAQGITHMITKNSGGAQTRAKIDAAAALGIVSLVVEREHRAGGTQVESVAEALAAIHELASPF